MSNPPQAAESSRQGAANYSRPSTSQRPNTASGSRPNTGGATGDVHAHDYGQTSRRPPSSRRRRSRRPPTARVGTADSGISEISELPDQEFFPEGEDFGEDFDEDDEEPEDDVFAFERPVTGAVPPAGFSGSEYTSSVPNTGMGGFSTDGSHVGAYPQPGPSNQPSTSGHAHSQSGEISPEVTSTGMMEAASTVPELQYDKQHPPPFSGRDNLNNSSFAFMNKLNRERDEQRRASRVPRTSESLLSRLQRRSLNTATTNATHTTDVTNMTRLDSNDTSDINSFDTSFMSEGTASKFNSKSSVPLIPSTAGGMSDFSATVSGGSSVGGSRGLMSRGSYGMTELTGDMTVPDGKTTWGDGMGGMQKEASEGGSMAGVDIDMMEEDSPYPEVRASVSNIDDPEMPTLTFRAWVLGILFTLIGAACNTFFHFRTPAPSISPFIIQLVSYPCGKFMAWCLPIRTFYLPRWLGSGEFSLNPGPFNIKEHALIVIMANVSVTSAYALFATVSTELWYGKRMGVGFEILFILVTQLTGFSFAGICRRFVVWPASMIWPSNLVITTNLNTFHAEDESFQGGMTRFKFLFITGGAAFAYYFLPGFLFTALSYFSFICWIAPNNKVVNELFGVSTGLGLSILTFDWSQISWIGSPLTAPWWAQVNIGIGFLLFYWIIVPIMYFTNVWNFAYLPLNVIEAADRYGAAYNIFNILTPDLNLNKTAYAEYSPVYLSASYSMTFMTSFALSTAVIVHTILYHGPRIYRAIINIRSEVDDIHLKLMRQYPEVPDWWYLALYLVCFVLTVVALEVYHTGYPIWGYLIAILVPVVYAIPAALIFAMTSQQIAINLLAELIPGYTFQGQPIPGMLFKVISVGSLAETLTFVQCLKLGHYMKIPPRATFIAQLCATAISCLVQVGTKELLFSTVDDVCGNKPENLLSCANTKVFFTSSVIWGLIGPERLFSNGKLYHPQVYAALIGAILPIPIWLWVRKHPRSILRNLNIPVLLNGGTFIPPATGINFASFLGVGFVFQFWIRRRYFAWWSKYNYVLSVALDTGTALAALFIFLVLDLPDARINWWGNSVYTRTVDWQGDGAAYLSAPADGFGPTSW